MPLSERGRPACTAARFGASVALALILGPGLLVEAVPAQGGSGVIRSAQDITFAMIHTTAAMRTYGMDRVRRFLDDNGELIGVQERLLHTHDGATEDFRLDYLGLESGSEQAARTWQTTYARESGLLHRHGSFSVHDPVAAEQNYVIVWLGSTTRISRPVERVVVLPRRLDRSIWILDLDRETGLILYTAEFDTQARLVSELEVVRLRLGREVLIPETTWAWRPWMIVDEYRSFGDARNSLGAPGASMVQPDPSRLPAGYSLGEVRVVENPLNGNKSLVMTYGDGVDQFFVVESHDNLQVFSGLRVGLSSQRGNTVAYFQDSSLGAFLFQEGPLRFMVVGRGTMAGLKRTVESVYRQVLGR